MPIGVVKTAKDERYWRECKASVRKSHPKLKTDSDRFYSIVMGCFKRRKGTVLTKKKKG